MKIWIFNHYAHPPDLPGITRHYDLAQELVKRGHSVIIFATSHHYQQKEGRLQQGENWKIENINGVQFVWTRSPSYKRDDWRREWNMVVFMFRASLLGQKLPKFMPEIGQPDVVIGSSPDLLTPIAAYLAAWRFQVPFVMEVRDLWPLSLVEMGTFGASNPIVKALQVIEKFLYQQAELIVTLLPMAHEYITGCGVPREKIVWIPNGVDISRFDQNVNPRLMSDGFRVMYFGAHGRVNVIEVLIEAAKIVQDKGYQDVKFIFVGDGPRKPQLIEQSKKMGLNNVEFLNPVPKSMVPMMLQEADSLALSLEDTPLYKYGISVNKIFDYMASGKPVIFSGQAANNPVEEARCGITVPPKNSQAIAEAIITLYRMPQEAREDMGRRGQEYVAEYHDISKLAGLLELTLTNLLAGRR